MNLGIGGTGKLWSSSGEEFPLSFLLGVFYRVVAELGRTLQMLPLALEQNTVLRLDHWHPLAAQAVTAITEQCDLCNGEANQLSGAPPFAWSALPEPVLCKLKLQQLVIGSTARLLYLPGALFVFFKIGWTTGFEATH